MAKFTNISNGPRGGYLGGQLVMVEAGADAELDDAPEEWFAKAGSKAAKEAGEDGPLDHDGDGRKGGMKGVEPKA
jgi:hypothetical protein